MKRVELTDVTSNLLLISSVLLAMTPLLLGDKLELIATSAMREIAIMFDQMGTFLINLL